MKSLITSVIVFLSSYIVAQNVTPPSIVVESFYSGLSGPVGLYHCNDHRLFILEKNVGDIEIIDTTGAYIGTFLNVGSLISTGSERGLLGMAFHPNYAANGFFYINYTNGPGHTVIARYQVSTSNPNVANANSASIIMTINQPYGNHNGGHMAFGPDGYLYIGMGDGGSSGDPGNRAQNMNELLGKMLRIDVNGTAPYDIPPSNPFVGQSNIQPEIWASGLRNPWKFSFDRANGDLWIADVGQNVREEINRQLGSSPGGENYGWRCYEGNATYNTSGCAASNTMAFPVADYGHSAPYSFCSITGGAVYRGTKYQALEGIYFFTDYCAGVLYGLTSNESNVYTTTNFGSAGAAVVAIQEDAAGELYIVRQGGTIGRIKDACGSFQPSISVNESGALISTSASQYWWFDSNGPISGATAQTYTPTTPGSYFVNASNGSCTRSSNALDWVILGGVAGCTYAAATNYNPDASLDNGSCIFGTQAGCPGDMDGNGLISVNDLLLFMNVFGTLCNE